ncbi:GDSL-type esterase/lipase family protein [Rubripirellula tenax]|uniref:GDSL-type esterase/lipase family protein n=1 Tax=Rubripirellula tenax TaxID=2528015 RepID=UPI001C938A63|nr:GDSL-type esterase/lipase family protein [Rubripirellula tenax]
MKVIKLPLSLVVVFLGTNDFQSMHHYSANQSAQGVASLVTAIRQAPIEPGMLVPEVMVVAPPAIEQVQGEMATKFQGAQRNAIGLPAALRDVANSLQCDFFDAGKVAQTSQVDGIHLDADQHRNLGVAIAASVLPILNRNQNTAA